MRKYCFTYIALVLLFALALSSCTNDPGTTPVTPDTPEEQKPALVYSREYWGEWKKMDQSETWLINSTSIKVNGNALESEVSLSKPSENVISVTMNGQTDCLYAVRTASSSITGNVVSTDGSRDITDGWLSIIVQNINDIYDVVETRTDADGGFTADNLISGEEYNVKIGDTSLNITPSFDGENIGTITLMSGVNFKVTLSNNNSVMYAGSDYYSMNLIIENIGDTNCTAATYSLTGDDGLEVINNYSDGVLLRTVAAGEKKIIPLRVKCSIPESETAIKRLNLTITDKNGTTWNDSVSLKFYRDSVTINVASENGRPISGVIIGDGRTYSITNRTNYSISIPVTAESYLMVFSGAIANASRNTESAYSIGVNCSATSAANLLTELGTATNSYEPNDDENHAKAVIFGKSIVSYLYENDIDYYFLEPLHMWDAGLVTSEATCTEEGSVTYTCTVCGETYNAILPSTGHSFSQDWEKDANYHWHSSTCGHDVISDKASHTWKEKTVTIAPTFTTEGERILSCTVCGQEKTETIPKLYYEIGGIGPAGGFIFYDCDADNDSGNADGLISSECGWRYLEAAPADLRVVEGVPTINSSLAGYSDATTSYKFGYYRTESDGDNLFINGTAEYDSSNCTTESVGSGLQNTSLLVSAMGNEAYKEQNGSETITDYAAKLCYNLVHNANGMTFTDWFLPSKDEVILMYSNLKAKGIGVFSDAYYWSSYEGKNTTTGVWGMSFQHESQSEYKRSAEYRVRPVRAFLLEEPEGHVFSNEWAKDADYHWHASTCGHNVISEKAQHTWIAGAILSEPSKTTEGVQSFECATCGQTKTESIPTIPYEIGDIGPAGGTVFYDCDADNDSGNADGLISSECGWRYLEAAPADLKVVDGVPTIDSTVPGYSEAKKDYAFGYYRTTVDGTDLFLNGTSAYSSTNCTGTSIGTGKSNTQLIVYRMGSEAYRYSSRYSSNPEKIPDYTAKLCDILSITVNGVSFEDWFLPSKDELNMMRTQLYAKGLGGFDVYRHYWSSSEYSTDVYEAWNQNFNTGSQYNEPRSTSDGVRPVRAFLQNEQEGHHYEQIILKEPSCTENGEVRYTCSGCGYTYDMTLPSFGHSFSNEWSKNASYHWHASTCGHDVVNAIESHKWYNVSRTIEPTHTTDGLLTYTCTVCGQTKTESIPALVDNHTFSDEWSKDENYHWHDSTCGHDVVDGRTEHVLSSSHTVAQYGFEFKYDICETCGYEQLDTSDYVKYLELEPYNSGQEWIITGLNDRDITVLAIPHKIEGKPVTTIKRDAFITCFDLQTIVIPNSVTQINRGAFIYCNSLENIVFDDNPNYRFENGMLLDKEGTVLVACPNADISEIPKTICTIFTDAFYYNKSISDISFEEGSVIQTIEENAFRGSSLSSISIPNTVTSIGDFAFDGCNNLVSVGALPDSLSTIGRRTFYECEKLSDISLNPQLKTIEQYAFYGCVGLTEITIPDSVELIEKAAFYKCSNLTRIIIGKNVSEIGESVFLNCPNLTEIVVDNNNLYYSSENGMLFNKDKTELLAYPSATGVITVPNTVKTIGYGAFVDTQITEISIPEGTTTIESYSICFNYQLHTVNLPSSIESIGEEAFRFCRKLTTINYAGTKEQWNAISKNPIWHTDVPDACIIHCSDGDVLIE